MDLPDRTARRAIIETHLERRDQATQGLDLEALVDATDGFSGAELETAIVAALYRAVGEDRSVNTEILLKEVASTVPLSLSRAEDIADLRAWAERRAQAA